MWRGGKNLKEVSEWKTSKMEENKNYVCLKNKKFEEKGDYVFIYKAEIIEVAYYKSVHST
jgi:hypothetical protein